MEVPWYSIDFNKSFQLASLVLFDFLLNFFHKSLLINELPKHIDFRNHDSVFIEVPLHHASLDINQVRPHNVLDVKWEDIAGHLREDDVDVDVEAVIVVSDVNLHVASYFHVYEGLELAQQKHWEDQSAEDRDERTAESWFRQVFWHFPKHVELEEGVLKSHFE